MAKNSHKRRKHWMKTVKNHYELIGGLLRVSLMIAFEFFSSTILSDPFSSDCSTYLELASLVFHCETFTTFNSTIDQPVFFTVLLFVMDIACLRCIWIFMSILNYSGALFFCW